MLPDTYIALIRYIAHVIETRYHPAPLDIYPTLNHLTYSSLTSLLYMLLLTVTNDKFINNPAQVASLLSPSIFLHLVASTDFLLPYRSIVATSYFPFSSHYLYLAHIISYQLPPLLHLLHAMYCPVTMPSI